MTHQTEDFADELVESANDERGKLTSDISDYVRIYHENSYFPGVVVSKKMVSIPIYDTDLCKLGRKMPPSQLSKYGLSIVY